MNKIRACLETKIVRHYAKQGLEKFVSENLHHINKLREEEQYEQLNRISSHFMHQEYQSIRKEIIEIRKSLSEEEIKKIREKYGREIRSVNECMEKD